MAAGGNRAIAEMRGRPLSGSLGVGPILGEFEKAAGRRRPDQPGQPAEGRTAEPFHIATGVEPPPNRELTGRKFRESRAAGAAMSERLFRDQLAARSASRVSGQVRANASSTAEPRATPSLSKIGQALAGVDAHDRVRAGNFDHGRGSRRGIVIKPDFGNGIVERRRRKKRASDDLPQVVRAKRGDRGEGAE